MHKTRILQGELLVSKGALKNNSSLPEIGPKDVSPNDSWLEQKQIQAALEARKQVIDVERIEKSGVLSHAEWREELMLAEVTQKVGGYWQYLGHNVGKKLFLKPEEALFLIEVNCLLLKYNEVKVSLQQAYALLLRSKITLIQYKVYASLSRLGYRVYRHQRQEESKPRSYQQQIKPACSPNETTKEARLDNESGNGSKSTSTSDVANENKVQEVDLSNNNVSENKKHDTTTHRDQHSSEIDIQKNKSSEDLKQWTTPMDVDQPDVSEPSTSGYTKKTDLKLNKTKSSKYIEHKINKLKARKSKTKQCNMSNDYFKDIPDFSQNSTVNISAPDRRYLPGKIYLINHSYCLNVQKIQTKSTETEETYALSSSPNDSVNSVYQNNVTRLRHPASPHPHTFRANNWSEFFNFRFASQPHPFRQFNSWRPPTSINFFQLCMSFQRPFHYPQFGSRFMANPLLQPFMLPNINQDVSFNSNNNMHRKKRARNHIKQEHYNSIQRLATFIKISILELRLSDHNVTKLNHLIQTYNTRYKTRLRLSNDFTVIADENIIDTIEVDDDDEPRAKKIKNVDNLDSFNDNLKKLKQLASKLKSLEMKNEATSRHRRIFSNLIKGFNTSHSVDYYVNDNFDVINRNDLTALSSSESERIAEISCPPPKRKKLRNPFSILKQLSEKQIVEDSQVDADDSSTLCPFKYSELTTKVFRKDWLPGKNDFGRAEIISNEFASELIDIRREEFLFDFLKIQPDKFKNWLDVKISFLQCLQETCELFQYDVGPKNNGIESLVKPEEFNDAALVLKKLSIFDNNKAINVNANMEIDFDVYNRNVQHFKKSNRPLPHFRVICISESTTMPSGELVASLHSKYEDNVTIIFAVVGNGSISYLQVNPTDLPVYISSNDTIK